MENLQIFLLTLQIIIAVMMVIIILLQKSDGDSLSGIGGGSGGLTSGISAKASAGAISKFTIFLVAIFMLNSLVLARISATDKTSELQIDKIIEKNPSGYSKPILPEIE